MYLTRPFEYMRIARKISIFTYILLLLLTTSCKQEMVYPELCTKGCNNGECTIKWDGLTRIDQLEITVILQSKEEKYSGENLVKIPEDIYRRKIKFKYRAIAKSKMWIFGKDAVFEGEKTAFRTCYDSDSYSDDCNKFSNCGCSGINKKDCGGLCCRWVTGSGCQCK